MKAKKDTKSIELFLLVDFQVKKAHDYILLQISCLSVNFFEYFMNYNLNMQSFDECANRVIHKLVRFESGRPLHDYNSNDNDKTSKQLLQAVLKYAL